MKKKFRRKTEDNPKSDPLGIGLSAKTLTLIGVGIVAAVALKMYLDRKKAAAAASTGGFTPSQLPFDGPLPGERIQPPAGTVHPGMNGMGARNPVSPSAQGPPHAGSANGQMPQSPNAGGTSIRSRAGYESAGGFSGMGDGMLDGGNSRL